MNNFSTVSGNTHVASKPQLPEQNPDFLTREQSLESRVSHLEAEVNKQSSLMKEFLLILRRALMQQMSGEEKILNGGANSDPIIKARTEEVRRALGQLISFANKQTGIKPKQKPKKQEETDASTLGLPVYRKTNRSYRSGGYPK